MGMNQYGFHSNIYLKYSVKFLIYFNVTYRLLVESSWNFQETWVWISSVLRSNLLQKRLINAVSMATCSNILSAFLHIATNSKSIQSIFIKFYREAQHIGTSAWVGNIIIIIIIIIIINRHCPLLHWELHGYYRYQSMWFLWEHNCKIHSSLLHFVMQFKDLRMNLHELFRRYILRFINEQWTYLLHPAMSFLLFFCHSCH